MLATNHSLTNVVTQLLQYLKVKVTFSTVRAALENHPDYPSILSISDALNQWKVDNYILQVDKEKLDQLPLPFIAYLQNTRSFIVVIDVTNSHVVYQTKVGGETLNKSISEFLQEWSGVTLLAEATEHSGEKNYEQSRRKEILQSLKLPLVIALVLVIATFAAFYQYNNLTAIPPLLTAYCYC